MGNLYGLKTQQFLVRQNQEFYEWLSCLNERLVDPIRSLLKKHAETVLGSQKKKENVPIQFPFLDLLYILSLITVDSPRMEN